MKYTLDPDYTGPFGFENRIFYDYISGKTKADVQAKLGCSSDILDHVLKNTYISIPKQMQVTDMKCFFYGCDLS